MALEAADWRVAATNILVLVRIDHEEPYWAADAAKHLIAEGIQVDITPRLSEAMDKGWNGTNYPMPWCTRSEIREFSNAAQKIHEDIRHGQLYIHAHAQDGQSTVAVGTYLGPTASPSTSAARTTCAKSLPPTTHPPRPCSRSRRDTARRCAPARHP
ncbi:hypothetical protein [Streptomyces sp. NPDC096323]|uniref:hypothetical protein n=1 Tax=Streptomyces sp. NPDC096323 TaxID=3155822 RepID=UPI0033174B4F